MKHFSRAIIAVFMAILIGTLFPAQVFADTQDYISEVKVFVGNYDSAKKEGYTILKDGDNAVDLNQNAGATGMGGKGDKAVYLGYKTTQDRSEAITDLALMNMKGGYSIEDYEILMEKQMKEQIIPFVENFVAAIKEYRENYNSDNAANKQRATYVHDVLNKLIDDDTGKPLGDLLLNETKYELGDEAYNKLNDEQKKEHADILTIIAQSNGKATLMMENLLTRAADTSSDTWLDRFAANTYDDLLDETGLSPTKARKQVAKEYDDVAATILGMWEGFSKVLASYDEAVEGLTDYDTKDLDDAAKDFNRKQSDATALDFADAYTDGLIVAEQGESIAIHDYLESVEYEDGTMLDFFSKSYEEIEEDITALYPLAAALSDGQKAGLEFVSLKELIAIGMTKNGYEPKEDIVMNEISIYDGVDREIYNSGAVALTSDALRSKVTEMTEEDALLSPWTIAMWSICAGLVGATAASLVIAVKSATLINKYTPLIAKYGVPDDALYNAIKSLDFSKPMPKFNIEAVDQNLHMKYRSLVNAEESTYRMSSKLAVGCTVAVIIMVGISLYFTYRDLVAYYNVDFTPIPRYMVDEKDLIGYNAKGEKVVLKNQSAYYKAVTCNRAKNAEFYGTLGEIADLNGDVGKQWLALYAAKNDAELPILADSLKVVVNNTEVPAGYTTGIHMFGTDAAENLNNTLYDWNSKAPKVYVYFKTDETASTAGSTFTAGTLALSGSAGILLGAVVTALGMKASRKRIENKAVTV